MRGRDESIQLVLGTRLARIFVNSTKLAMGWRGGCCCSGAATFEVCERDLFPAVTLFFSAESSDCRRKYAGVRSCVAAVVFRGSVALSTIEIFIVLGRENVR